MQIDQSLFNNLKEKMFDENVTGLIEFFKHATGADLDYLEVKMESKDFNDLRSHIFACRFGKKQYIELLETNNTKAYRQFIDLAASGYNLVLKLQSSSIDALMPDDFIDKNY